MNSDDPLWYKDAIIYQVHVKAFFDSSNDGIGDFRGLTEKLDYLHDLGVTAVWLLPFYPSPLRDDGYDIADYVDVNPAYGALRDVRRFVREAHRRGLKVVTELVINHTSDQHPWFQRARRAKPGSAARRFYVWSDTDQRYQGTRIIFTDTETSNWAWDPEAQAYYWHRFFSHQPDLNFDNPQVLKAIVRAMRFWLDMGVDGLRLDAIPYLCEREGTNNENLPETHAVVKRLRAWLDAHYDDRMFLAEANQWPEDVRPYFGDGDECHMAFHFPVMPRIYMAVAQEDRHPVTDIMRQTPEIPESCQWAIFLRNHDELTLEMVSDRERDYLWSFYAADPRMRINIGIRRRLATLLDNDRRRVELLNSLLMSLPGTPIVYYGDEIGMGDNVFLGDRDGVRTPMQWSPDRNGGFSKADPAQLYLPPIMNPVYGFAAVNVEAQSRNSASLLSWMKRLITVRKSHKAFGRGSLTLLYPGNRKVLVYLRQYKEETILCVANLSRSAQPVELDLSQFAGRVPVELLGNSPFPPIGALPYFITLPGHAFYWFLLAEQAEAPPWHDTVTLLPEPQTLILPQGLAELLSGNARNTFESRVLPDYLPRQRWFGAKAATIRRVEAIESIPLPSSNGEPWLMTILRVDFRDAPSQLYSLPLAVAWESLKDEPMLRLGAWTLCKVRRGSKVGVLYDALADSAFGRALVRHMLSPVELAAPSGARLRFTATSRLQADYPLDEAAVAPLGREQSNTSLVVDDAMMLKAYRRLATGIHPEVEIGRFFADQSPFANTPTLLGALEHVNAGGRPTALAILQTFVRNQGDGWTYTVDHLERFLQQATLVSPAALSEKGDFHAVYLTLIGRLGRRTAEMHRAFADGSGRNFRPKPVTGADRAAWRRRVRKKVRDGSAALRRVRRALNAHDRALADDVLARRSEALLRVDQLMTADIGGLRCRCHGDYHLGQVALAQDDFYILDFEGEPGRTLGERRSRESPLRDVAGMLRSLDYAGWSALLTYREQPQVLTAALPHVRAWQERATTAFLASYRATVAGTPVQPSDAASEQRLLQLFLIEKLFHEITYEAEHRPTWTRIPLEGARRLLAEDTKVKP